MAPESLHTRILDNLKTAIVVVDPDLTVRYLNTAAETLLDASNKRYVGGPVNHLFFEADKDQASLEQAINELAAFTKRETRLTLANGRQITVDYAVTPTVDTGGTAHLIIELQPLDRLLRISREEGILATQQSTQLLVRGLAHEIKNPLGGLRGAAQLLARELPDSQLTDYTQIIIEEADRLRNLVDRLLGPNQLRKPAALNIHEVVERVRTLMEVETEGEIAFVRDYDPSLPELTGDREQLIQALLNIVRNAVQALQRSAVEQPQVQLKTRALRQFTIGSQRHRLVCLLEVSDNGPGIDRELQKNLFLPMISGHPNGSGLGLSISQSIINRHQGLIECRSQPGRTTFSIYLPLAPAGDDLTCEE